MKLKFYDDEFNINFITDTYADMFEGLYIGAVTEDEFWGDVTINIPQYSLDKDDIICSNDNPELIKEMIKQKYLTYQYDINANLGSYKVCKITDKLKREMKPVE